MKIWSYSFFIRISIPPLQTLKESSSKNYTFSRSFIGMSKELSAGRGIISVAIGIKGFVIRGENSIPQFFLSGSFSTLYLAPRYFSIIGSSSSALEE